VSGHEGPDTTGHVGSRNCHARGCRLPQCEDAARAWWRDYAQLKKRYNGSATIVPPGRAMAHVGRLRAAGVPDSTILRAAGLSENFLRGMAHRARGILSTTETRILAVHPGVHVQYLVPALGTTRRLRALGAMGWTLADVAARTPLAKKTLSLLMAGAQQQVTREGGEHIARVYDQLCMRRGSSERARIMARRKGWAPPLAWDEDDLDDPDAEPYMDDEEPDAELNLSEFMRLLDYGVIREQAAARLGVTLGAIEAAARRHGREDVLDRIATRPRRKTPAYS
jgi:hypothetical protein